MCLAIPGEVLETYERDGLCFGKVRFASVSREVCLQAHPDAQTGDFVLVHVGFAIAKIDAEEAQRVWSMLEELDASELEVADGAFEAEGRRVS